MAMIDTLKLAQRLRDKAGLPPAQAEEIAAALDDAFTERVATKTDLDLATRELKTDIADLRAEFYRAIHTQTLTIVGSMIGLLGLLFAALHFWPPH